MAIGWRDIIGNSKAWQDYRDKDKETRLKQEAIDTNDYTSPYYTFTPQAADRIRSAVPKVEQNIFEDNKPPTYQDNGFWDKFRKLNLEDSKLVKTLSAPINKLYDIPLTQRIITTAGEALAGPGAYKNDDGSVMRPKDTNSKVGNIAADILGTGLGFGMPVAGLNNSLQGAANKIVKPVENLLPAATTKAGEYGVNALKNGLEFGVLNTAQGLGEGNSIKDSLKSGAEGVLQGAAFGTVLKGAGELLPKIKKTVSPEWKTTFESGKLPETPKAETPIVEPPKVQTKTSEPLAPKLKTMASSMSKDELNIPLKESKLPKSFDSSEFVAPEVKKALENSPERVYVPDSNKRQWKDATEAVQKDFEGTLSRIMTKGKFDSADDVAQGFALMDELQKKGDFKAAADLAESMIPKSRALGQAVQAHSIIGRLSPQGVLQYTAKQFDKANEFLPANSKIKLTEEKAKKLVDLSKEIQGMPEGRGKDIASALLEKQINDEIPVSAAQKISTVQAMSHLINVKTALRNVLGNTAFNIAETISNLYAIPFDRAISAMKTNTRSVTLPNFKAFGKGFKQGFKESAEEVRLGIDLSGYNKYNTKPMQVFKGTGGVVDKVLSKLEKALNYELKVPDEAFKRGVIEDSLNQQMKLAGVNKATPEMIEQANKEALFRTFQDNSLPAQIFQGSKDLFNKIGIGHKVQGSSGLKTREFGAGDFVVKYTKVPGNIIARTIEYSPIGYFKTLSILHDAKISGKLTQRDLAMTLGRATNGTMLIGMGVLMNRLGLLKSEEKDKDARELDRAAGLGNYKLNISALNRMLNSGNYSKQDLKSGDTLASYNWLQPVSTAFAIGAAIDNETKKTGLSSEAVLKAGSVGLDEVLDIPTLVTIQSMFYEAQKKDSTALDIASVPIKEAIPGFIPSQGRQIAQTLDPVYRDTKGDTSTETFTNKLKANLPVLSKTLRPKITPTGETKENQLPLLNLLSPAQITKYKPLEITPKLKQLQQDTGDASFYPNSSAPNSFKYKKENIVLTQKEKSDFLKTLGKNTIQEYNKILYNVNIDSLTDNSKNGLIKTLNKQKDEAYERAKMELLKNRGKK